MKARVGATGLVGLRPVRRHPAGPAELRAAAEPHRRDLAGGNGELQIPIVFVADIEEDRVGDLAGERRAGQELS